MGNTYLDDCYMSGPTFIKPYQRNPWIKDQLGSDLLSTILHLQLPNFVSCGRDKPSHMTKLLWQNMEAPVSIFQESPLAGEPRERLFHIHSVNRYQLRTK